MTILVRALYYMYVCVCVSIYLNWNYKSCSAVESRSSHALRMFRRRSFGWATMDQHLLPLVTLSSHNCVCRSSVRHFGRTTWIVLFLKQHFCDICVHAASAPVRSGSVAGCRLLYCSYWTPVIRQRPCMVVLFCAPRSCKPRVVGAALFRPTFALFISGSIAFRLLLVRCIHLPDSDTEHLLLNVPCHRLYQ